jgi:long-chain acyl-CoA synthetase
MLRTSLFADPQGRFLDDVILSSCRKFAAKTAIIDLSCGRRITYAEYAELVESLARGLIAAGLRPGEALAINLPNSWEFCAAFHAASMVGAVATPLNPAYRAREVCYQLEVSGAVILVTDGPNIAGMNLSGLPDLRRVYVTRAAAPGTEPFQSLLRPVSSTIPQRTAAPEQTVVALPFSSGTTGLPKGVMLSHSNLVANVFQYLGPNAGSLSREDVLPGFLPLYHIYGLNVVLNPVLTLGARLLLMPRFQPDLLLRLIADENPSTIPAVPPALNALCEAAEAGQFPKDHGVRWAMCGAAPLPPELARRFTSLTGIPVCQGYGMTEASPVTHLGYLEPELYRPDSIGQPLVQTECRVVNENGNEVANGECGQLLMRGPQFMVGYWKEPQATASVLRDGWFWSGDVVRRTSDDFYYVVDRCKEMIKYKGFQVAPAEVEAVLMEHCAVHDCGVVGLQDASAGEVPIAFVALRQGFTAGKKLEEELRAFVIERIASYKQPREIRFVAALPRTPSGKILRRELRTQL